MDIIVGDYLKDVIGGGYFKVEMIGKKAIVLRVLNLENITNIDCEFLLIEDDSWFKYYANENKYAFIKITKDEMMIEML